jgi:hypothetical protein
MYNISVTIYFIILQSKSMDLSIPAGLSPARSHGGAELSEILNFRKDLFRDLRAELGHLKTCQTALLVFSSTGAGIFIGLLGNTNTFIPQSYLLLLPLIFLLPLWIIFYEKARTIARIVGFLRIQEKLYVLQSRMAVIGWESAMEQYKNKQKIWDDRDLDTEFPIPEKKSTTSPYWFWVFFTFTALSLTCLLLSGIFLPVDVIWKIVILSGILVASILFKKILELKRIGKINNDSNSRKNKEHTNIDTFTTKAKRLTLIFLLGTVSSLIIVYSLFWFYGANPYSLFGYELFSISPKGESLLYDELLPALIYTAFFAFFIYTLSIARWMYLNLVIGRYSYFLFAKRWQIILDIQYDEEKNIVGYVNWKDKLEDIKRKNEAGNAPGTGQ